LAPTAHSEVARYRMILYDFGIKKLQVTGRTRAKTEGRRAAKLRDNQGHQRFVAPRRST
jgi:hypothetical protein